MILNANQINDIINNEISRGNSTIELTISDEKRIHDLFNTSMKNDLNKNKTLEEQGALVTAIFTAVIRKEKDYVILQQHSENRHLDYFDNFLADGETQRVVDAFKENNIPPDVLRGVRKTEDLNNQRVKGFKDLILNQKVERTEDGSYIVVEFTIDYKGKRIYSFNRGEDFKDFELTGTNITTKSGKKSSSLYLREFKSRSRGSIFEIQMKNGQIRYKDSKGRFTSL